MTKNEGGKNRNGTRKRLSQRNYFLQLSIVIIGILVTFQGSAWTEKRAQRKQMREILVMVEDELRANLNELRECKGWIERELSGMEFFKRYMANIEDAPEDSLKHYSYALNFADQFFYASDAIEVLKTSPSPVNTMDKGLLRKIFSCYELQGRLFASLNNYYHEKFGIVGSFYYSLDKHTTDALYNERNYTPYIIKYLQNPSTRNFILGANGHIGSTPLLLDDAGDLFEDTIESINNYTGGKKIRRTHN